MKVIVLMAGEGKRFKDVGYEVAKPFIDIDGKPMVQRTTDSLPWLMDIPEENLTFVMLKRDVSKENIEKLRDIYGKNINVVTLDTVTRGNLESAYLALESILLWDVAGRYDELLILDADNVYEGDGVLQFIQSKKRVHGTFGAICHFDSIDEKSHWCFAETGLGGKVRGIYEKSEESRIRGGKPMVGTFYFSSCDLFKAVTNQILNDRTTTAGEFYMSQAVDKLLALDIPVYSCKVLGVEPLGTPEYVTQYIARRAPISTQSFVPFEETMLLHYGAVPTRKKPKRQLRICIDIDGTINHTKKPGEEYGNEQLQIGAVACIRTWKKRGHYIILYTARHMNTCNANVGQVIARQGMTTLKWLEDNDIPFDEIHFGKPHADVFIDDAAWRHTSWGNTDKRIEDLESQGGRFSDDYHKVSDQKKDEKDVD